MYLKNENALKLLYQELNKMHGLYQIYVVITIVGNLVLRVAIAGTDHWLYF